MVPSRVRLLLVRGSLTPAFPRSCHQRRARGARRADNLTTATHPTREHHPAAARVNRPDSSCTRTVLPAPRAEPCHVGGRRTRSALGLLAPLSDRWLSLDVRKGSRLATREPFAAEVTPHHVHPAVAAHVDAQRPRLVDRTPAHVARPVAGQPAQLAVSLSHYASLHSIPWASANRRPSSQFPAAPTAASSPAPNQASRRIGAQSVTTMPTSARDPISRSAISSSVASTSSPADLRSPRDHEIARLPFESRSHSCHRSSASASPSRYTARSSSHGVRESFARVRVFD